MPSINDDERDEQTQKHSSLSNPSSAVKKLSPSLLYPLSVKTTYYAISPFYGYYGSMHHLTNCFTGPMVSSVVFGAVFTGLDVMGGRARFTPTNVGTYAAFIYTYNAIQCPMEAIHKRESLLHNVIGAGLLGSIGVQTRRVGIPFVNELFFYKYPFISPPMMGFVVYGMMGGAFGMLGHKSF